MVEANEADIKAALKHLGFDSIADLHYWATDNHELNRFDALCQILAQHRTEALAERDALIAEVREQVALLYVASGCDCCRDDKGWYAASARLGDLLKAPRYDDDSERVDWYAVRDEYAALETKHD